MDLKNSDGSNNEVRALVLTYYNRINSNDFNNNEKLTFINSLSVLQSSAEFWNSYLCFKPTTNRVDDGAVVIMSDWVGAVAGAAAGGPAFALSGIVGAAASSAFTAFVNSQTEEEVECG